MDKLNIWQGHDRIHFPESGVQPVTEQQDAPGSHKYLPSALQNARNPIRYELQRFFPKNNSERPPKDELYRSHSGFPTTRTNAIKIGTCDPRNGEYFNDSGDDDDFDYDPRDDDGY